MLLFLRKHVRKIQYTNIRFSYHLAAIYLKLAVDPPDRRSECFLSLGFRRALCAVTPGTPRNRAALKARLQRYIIICITQKPGVTAQKARLNPRLEKHSGLWPDQTKVLYVTLFTKACKENTVHKYSIFISPCSDIFKTSC